ncbi:LuxR C-terminal-related transcriptional regulator [Leucobacter luti]|uniref:helix-turn-helix transcriptional regulator n=1 Tax=Leucobacter luti TaxID=340320 RepID=UPI003CFFB9B1
MFDRSATSGDPWQHRPDERPDPRAIRALDELGRIIDAGDAAAANRYVRRSWSTLLRGDIESLRRRLLDIDQRQRSTYPLILLLQAIATLPSRFRRAHAVRYFLQAVRTARALGDAMDPIDRALVHTGDAVACRVVGPHSRARKTAAVAAEQLRQLDASQLAEVGGTALLFCQAGRSVNAAGDTAEALALFEEGLSAVNLDDPDEGFGNLAMLCGIHALDGELAVAGDYLEFARTGPWSEQVTRGYSGTWYRLAEAIAALEREDPGLATRHLDLMDHDPRTIEDWITIAGVAALIGVAAGRGPEALSELEQTVAYRGREGRSPRARAALAPIRALLETAQGAPGTAVATLKRDGAQGAVACVALARALLALDKPLDALQQAQRLPHLADGPPPVRFELEALAIELAARIRIPSRSPGRSLPRRIGHLATANGLRLPLMLLPPEDFAAVRDCLIEAGFAGVYGPHTRGLIEQPHRLSKLTSRERVVFDLIAAGASPQEIATSQFVSINTVKTQTRSIYRKLSLGGREELIVFATQLGLPEAPRTGE